jgi:CheY-like chemotaxis protein
VILCELELPLVSGLELVEELRALGARLPIVLLGRPDGSAARQLPRTGVTATVDADCHLDELRYLVHHLAQREDPTALLPAGSPPGGGW